MIKKVALFLVLFIGLAIAAVLVKAALSSPEYRVERSRSVPAAADAVFAQFNSHKKFNAFNPWAKMEPTAKITYDGPETGIGAASSWDGEMIGKGTATITESKPNELIRLRMDWKSPMEGTSTVEYTFAPDGEKTRVTWAMFGTNDFIGKLMSLFMDCESMCGPEFEKGLADMEKILTTATP